MARERAGRDASIRYGRELIPGHDRRHKTRPSARCSTKQPTARARRAVGVRADESASRRQLYTRGGRRGRRDGIINRGDGTVAYGPIRNWTTTEVWAHIARQQFRSTRSTPSSAR